MSFFALLALVGAARAELATAPDAAAVAENNRAVGLMGRYDYAAAEPLFAHLARQWPNWLEVRVNHAIAVLNRQQEGDEAAALELVRRVIEESPGNLRAHYVSGLLQLYLGMPDQAEVHFRRVADADPDDAYAAYYLAQCLAQRGQFADALSRYRQAIESDPYLRSAHYGAFQAARRLGTHDEARQWLTEYQALSRNPRARLAEFRYTRMGPKADALAVDRPQAKPAVRPAGLLFAPAKQIASTAEEPAFDGVASLTVADVDGDGRLDLFVAGGSAPDSKNRVLTGDAQGDFAVAPGHPLAAVAGVNAALWGDFDNDGLSDVYLCRNGRNQLWRQSAVGRWEDVTEASGAAGGDANTVDGAFFDADHDGDLDLFLVNGDGPNELLNNNLDGTFRALAGERGIAGNTRSRTVVPVDIDGDRDLDLLVLNRVPPHEFYVNDRLWSYRPLPGVEALLAAPALAAVAADLDADGREELLMFAADGALSAWSRAADGTLAARELASLPAVPGDWAQLGALDVSGDGRLEVLAASAAGWIVLDRSGRILFRYDADADSPLVAVAPVLRSARSGPALATLQKNKSLLLHGPGPGRHPFLALRLTGRAEAGSATRSNASGIGARIALRVDSRWTLPPVVRAHSGPGQSLQPLAMGLGGAERADFVTIDWSNGVFQSELDLAAGRLHTIAETQRQLSSCPVLFAWDGKGYAFVTDFLGVGGLGYAVAPGEYATPRPWENLLLPAGLLQPDEGRLKLKLTEPMEEVAYIDGVRLVAWDLPPGWNMVLDERMGLAAPMPTGEPRFYRSGQVAARAINASGVVLTDVLSAVDGNAAPVGTPDARFVGRLNHDNVLVLEFARPLDALPGVPLLVADGWVEYPYSQTMFAAWQAGAAYRAPTIEARDRDGRWHTLLEQFGYPAGMPRRMSVPLDGLPAGATALRIGGNMEIYWDRLAVVQVESAPDVRRIELPLRLARAAKSGFPRWDYGPQRRPLLDYSRRKPFADTRHMAGFYTRFGPVEPLLERVDDALAVIGPGEEIHLEFEAPVQPPPAGWQRHYVLESNGWAKDMDLFTRGGESVGPMPGSGHAAARRDRLHARYNTRYRDG